MDKHLGDALDAYNLMPADLPGIVEAWAERFAVLDQPAPEDAKTVFRRLHPEAANWDTLIIGQFIPRSDGGLTVTFEFTVDETENDGYPDDCGSVTFTAGQGRELLLAKENEPTVHQHRRLIEERDAFATGKRPVWWLLRDGSPVRQANDYRDELNTVRRAERSLEHAEETLAQVNQLQKALDTRTPLTREAKMTFGPVSVNVRGVKPLSPVVEKDRWGMDKRAVRVSDVNSCAEALVGAVPEYERMQAIHDEATALPDGPLRDYLLGQRPTVFYNGTEGTGHRARTVKKQYTPVSELLIDHRKATEAHKKATSQQADLNKRLRLIRRELEAKVKADSKALAAAQKTADAVWVAGWPGKKGAPKPVPAVTADSLW